MIHLGHTLKRLRIESGLDWEQIKAAATKAGCSVGKSTIERQESSPVPTMEPGKLKPLLEAYNISYEEFAMRVAIEWHHLEGSSLRLDAVRGLANLQPMELARVAAQIVDMAAANIAAVSDAQRETANRVVHAAVVEVGQLPRGSKRHPSHGKKKAGSEG